mgnify:CR=1 FL=1
MRSLRAFRGREPRGVEEGLSSTRRLLVATAMTGEHRHRSAGKQVMLDLNDVGLPIHVSQAGHQDVGPVGAVTDVVVLSEYAHCPRVGEHRLDRLVARRSEDLGLRRREAADLKKKSALDVDRLATLDTPRSTERILSFDIEEDRCAEELRTTPACPARGERRRR